MVRLIFFLTAALMMSGPVQADSCFSTNCPVVVTLDWSKKTIAIKVDGQKVELDSSRFSASSYGGFWCSGREQRLPIEQCADGDKIFDKPAYGLIGLHFRKNSNARGPYVYIDQYAPIVGARESYPLASLGKRVDSSGRVILVSKATAETLRGLVETRGAKNVWFRAEK